MTGALGARLLEVSEKRNGKGKDVEWSEKIRIVVTIVI
jgi:hypothetical protein